jgi:hypothetical protein
MILLSKKYYSLIFPYLMVMGLIMVISYDSRLFLHKFKIDYLVIMGGNMLLFLLSCFTLKLHLKAKSKKNPLASSNSVLMVTLLKLVIIGVSTFSYLLSAGNKRSVFAVIVCMILYVVYTIMDLRIALKLNKE